MNILHIRSQYVVDGGVETFLKALVSRLATRGIGNHIMVLRPGDMNRPCFCESLTGQPGISFETVRWDKKTFAATAVRSVLRVVRERHIDVLHTHDNRADLLGLLVAAILRRPVGWVASAHGWVDQPLKSGLISRIDKVVVRFADRVHFASACLFGQIRCAPDKLVAIPYFLDSSHFSVARDVHPLRRQWGGSEHSMILGMVGRLGVEKGHKYLLRAMARVAPDFPRVKLVIVGDGPLREPLQQLMRQLHLEPHVVFTGFHEDALAACSAFDVLVHSSLTESLSIVLLEALHLGKPIVATDVGANRDLVVPGENGYLVPPGDERALAEAMVRILRARDELAEFSLASRRVLKERFSPDRIIEQYGRLYEEAGHRREDRN